MSTKDHDDVRKLAPEFATFDDAKLAQMEAITGASRVVAFRRMGHARTDDVMHADRPPCREQARPRTIYSD